MPRCPHCKGTGEAPIKLQQECVGCQKALTLTFATDEDWRAFLHRSGMVYCKDCQPADRLTTPQGSIGEKEYD